MVDRCRSRQRCRQRHQEREAGDGRIDRADQPCAGHACQVRLNKPRKPSTPRSVAAGLFYVQTVEFPCPPSQLRAHCSGSSPLLYDRCSFLDTAVNGLDERCSVVRRKIDRHESKEWLICIHSRQVDARV